MSQLAKLMYLIRHGATDANLRKPYLLQGQRGDLPLSTIGHRQAEAAAAVIGERSIRVVYTSPLRRAHETAEIIAARHNLPVKPIDGVTECDVGDWEGLSWDDVHRQYPEYVKSFDADPANVPYLNGESFQAVQDRAVPAINRLARESPGDLVIVTHNIVGRVYVAHSLGLPTAQARRIRLDNGGISSFAVNETLKLVTLNSVLHLGGLVEL